MLGLLLVSICCFVTLDIFYLLMKYIYDQRN